MDHLKSVEAVERYRQQLARTYGVGIEFRSGPSAPFDATTQLCWHHGRSRHVVLLHPPCEHFHEPHIRAHELTHIHLASETFRISGRVPRFGVAVTIDPAKISETATRTGTMKEQEMLAVEGELSAEDRWKRQIANCGCDRILDMVVEHKIKQNTELAVLSATQFISLHTQMQARVHELKSYHQFSISAPKAQLPPENLTIPSLAIDFAYALFLDRLIGKFTGYFAAFSNAVDTEEAKNLAETICDFVQGRISSLQAAGEYSLVDDVMKMAGLHALYEWS